MSLSATCIQRPVLTWVLSIIIILFGVIGFTYLGVREYPNVDPAVISVDTSYPGANADVIESQITAISRGRHQRGARHSHHQLHQPRRPQQHHD